MSLKAKIEAVIYASEEPVTLGQLVSLLGQEAQAELDAAAGLQAQLALRDGDVPLLLEGAGANNLEEAGANDQDALNAEILGDREPEAMSEIAADQFSGTQAEAPDRTSEAADANPAATEPADIEPAATESASRTPGEPSAAEVRARERRLRDYVRSVLDGLTADYNKGDHGLEIREVAGGFRFATKPEYHDAVRGFVRSLKPPLKLSLQALETLAVVAYKQPVTAPEVSEIRGVDSGGVLGSLLTRKLVTTAGRKQVIGRPILYKTTKEFLLRFGLKDLAELPSIEEFERLASSFHDAVQEEIPMSNTPVVPVGTAAEEPRMTSADVARELEPSRNTHAAQADGLPSTSDGDPNASALTPDEVSAEHLTPAADGPGEFTGNESAPPADNAVNDGRLSGLPPTYDTPSDEISGSPANDAAVQSEQLGDRGSDD